MALAIDQLVGARPKMGCLKKVGTHRTLDLDRTPPVASIQMYLLTDQKHAPAFRTSIYSLSHSTSLLVEGHVLEKLAES